GDLIGHHVLLGVEAKAGQESTHAVGVHFTARCSLEEGDLRGDALECFPCPETVQHTSLIVVGRIEGGDRRGGIGGRVEGDHRDPLGGGPAYGGHDAGGDTGNQDDCLGALGN